MENDILFLLNPYSNEGKARNNWRKFAKKFPLLPENPVDISLEPDLTKTINKYKPKIIAIAGGDGTINAVCNAIIKMNHKPELAILPFGFGNALAYCFGVETVEKAVHVLIDKPNSITIDVFDTNIPQKHIGIFNVSVGFDARIVHIRDNYRYIGLGSYILSGIRGILFHPETEMKFTIDHSVTLNATASSLVIANCPIIGQNYVIASNAKLNDGLLDCTLFSTKYDYVTNLRLKGFKHPFYSEVGKLHFKAKHIRIEGEPFVQIDGDPVISKEKLEVEVSPKKVTFLRNLNKNVDILYKPFIA